MIDINRVPASQIENFSFRDFDKMHVCKYSITRYW